MKTIYLNFLGNSIEYDLTGHTFSFYHAKMGMYLRNGYLSSIGTGIDTFNLKEFGNVIPVITEYDTGRKLIIEYSVGTDCTVKFKLEFMISRQDIGLKINGAYGAHFCIKGDLHWGNEMDKSTFPVCLDRKRKELRSVSGPGASKIDNALFDRLTDSVLEIGVSGKTKLIYNWDKEHYEFSLLCHEDYAESIYSFKIIENYYSNKFGIPYNCISPKKQFQTPPVGWMTWYAVKFEASEQKVLENASWLEENLLKYGADCLWVDWEWYHSNLNGTETEGIDTFQPDVKKYPQGLKYLSDEIKKKGLIPALWIGPTNDTNKNRLLLEHPEWLLVHEPRWCGQWWIDLSNPEVVDDYIPTVFKQILEWGFDAIKWDCIPVSMEILDKHHSLLYSREKDSEQLMRDIILAARKIIGQKYLLSCSGNYFRDITFAMDLFDGARIVGDIFNWNDFVKEAVERIARYYCYHNVVLYTDIDNVVIREEFNTMDQARSRVSLVSLCGMPFTMGDNLPELSQERIELIKKTIPVIDMHPADIMDIAVDIDLFKINLLICRAYETWNVVDVMNTTCTCLKTSLDFNNDLHLDTEHNEEYIIYDFWDKKLLGRYFHSITLEIPAYGSRVLSIRRLVENPQIISTSRHITQGGFDLLHIEWISDKLILQGKSILVSNEEYEIVLHVPIGFKPTAVNGDITVKSNISHVEGAAWAVSLYTEISGVCSWEIYFVR